MFDPKKSTLRSFSPERAGCAESHVLKNRKPNFQKFSSVKEAKSAKPRKEIFDLKSDENGGKGVIYPSLTQEVDKVEKVGFIDPLPGEHGIRKSAITREPSKKSCEEEIRAERAIQHKRKRSGQLGELRKSLNCVQELMKDPKVQVT
jgi:hypothetical protein